MSWFQGLCRDSGRTFQTKETAEAWLIKEKVQVFSRMLPAQGGLL